MANKLAVKVFGLSYYNVLLDPKDFAALTDILSRATVYDDCYIDDLNGNYTHYYVEKPDAYLEASTRTPAQIITEDAYKDIRDAIKANQTNATTDA